MKLKIYLLILIFSLQYTHTKAQDANYWQSNYGPGGLLTPGAVVAYDNNQGLFYFNPALIAINPKSTVSVSATIYQIDMLKIKDGVGTGKNVQGKGFKINPQMVSGTVSFKNNKTIALGYALMHNPVLSYQATQRQDKQMQVLDDSYSPGNEYYIGQYAAHNRISQTTAMGSIGVKLNSHWSAGITAEGQIRSQDLYEQYSSRALINDTGSNTYLSPFTNVESSYQAVYWHLGLRFKAGLSYNAGRHHLGFVVSTPMISVKGSAIVTSDQVIADLHFPDANIQINMLANGRQTGLPVTYKMPLSIAAGYAMDFERGQVYITGEYFFKVNRYNLISPANTSFIRPDTGSNRSETTGLLQLSESRKSIGNMALGLSYYINPQITLIGSLSTDFSYSVDDKTVDYNGQTPNVSRWNNYHAQLGGNIKRKKVNLRAGLLLTYGTTSRYQQPINFDNPNESNLMLGDVKMVKGTFFSAGLLLSYVHNL